MAKKMKSDPPELLPMLMPASMMAKVSGIGEATLRTLMAQGEIEYLQIGNHRLLSVNAIWAYYETHKTPSKPAIKARFDAIQKMNAESAESNLSRKAHAFRDSDPTIRRQKWLLQKEPFKISVTVSGN